MTNPFVPASKGIKYKKTQHAETERLVRRLAWLNEALSLPKVREIDGRKTLRQFARERVVIENELQARGVLAESERVTHPSFMQVSILDEQGKVIRKTPFLPIDK